MPILADIAHDWGGDLGVTQTGDLALVTGSARTTERVIRRLITASTTAIQSDYPWQPPYGAGLGQKVGSAQVNTRNLQALILSQLLMEASVARSPAPTVQVTQPGVGVFQINCLYTDQSGSVQSFNFTLDNSAGG